MRRAYTRGRLRWWASAVVASFATLLPSRVAAGDPLGVGIVWHRGAGAESCPDEPTLRAEVARRMGLDPFARDGDLEIAVEVDRDVASWRATLRVRRGGTLDADPRTLTSRAESCAPLFESVALAIALLVEVEIETASADADAQGAPAEPDQAIAEVPASAEPGAPEAAADIEPVRTAPLECAPDEASGPPAECVPPQPTGIEGAVSIGPVLAVGLLPEAALGPSLHGEAAVLAWLRVDAGMYFLPSVRTGTFGFGLSAGWLGACGTPVAASFAALDLCANVHVGAIHAFTYVPDPTFPGDRPWVALAAGARGRLWLGPLLVSVAADGSVPLTHYEFLLTGGPTDIVVFAQSYVALGVRLEVGLRWGAS